MKEKPKTPYQRLLEDIREYCFKVKHRHTKSMFWYRKDSLASGYRLDDLYQRVLAAEQLGYDVVLVAADDGLRANYVKKVPDTPYGWD